MKKALICIFITGIIFVWYIYPTKQKVIVETPLYTRSQCQKSTLAAPRGFIGIADLSITKPESQQLLKELRASFVRVEVRWDNIEKTRGEYDWTELDAIVEFLNKENATAIFTINHPPVWSHDIEEFGNNTSIFITALAKRYKSYIDYYEIFNEPNLPGYGWPFPNSNMRHNATLYASVLTLTNQALRKVDEDAFIILGGLSISDHPQEFLHEIYQQTSKNCFDIVSIHPYGRSKKLVETLAEYRTITTKYNDAEKPIWFGEFGTSDDSIMLETLQDTLRQVNELDGLIWFSLRDLKPYGWNFGLVEYDGTKKPAFYEFKAYLKNEDTDD